MRAAVQKTNWGQELARGLGWCLSGLSTLAVILLGAAGLVGLMWGWADFSEPPFFFHVGALLGLGLIACAGAWLGALGGMRHVDLNPKLAISAGVFALAAFKWGEIIYMASALALIAVVILTRAGQRTKSAAAGVMDDDLSRAQRGETRLFEAEEPQVTFADVIGMEALKERLKAAASEIASSDGEARNGILLSGDPGNGKTFFAEALAGELGLPILRLSVADVVSRWVNQTPELVAQVFHDAAAQAPCVLFLDEVDSLIVDRSQIQRGDSEEAKTTNAFLTEIVNARRKQIVVVAATNHLDKLDPAAIREGRFDFKIEVPAPDFEARREILTRTANEHGRPLMQGALETAAQRWEGFSVARIRAVAEEAARSTTRDRLEYPDLKRALRTVQGRAGKLPPNTPHLEDLSFPHEQREALEGLATRLESIEDIEARGGKVPTGVLFYGPPGTGKTATARALAKTSGWAFLSVAGNELLGDPDRIDKLVREARDIRPVIIFIDEADDVLKNRSFSGQGYVSVTNRLLAAIDGAGGKVPDVLWVAATNHPDQLDPAALRAGRFTEKIGFELPDAEALARFVQDFVRKSRACWHENCRDAGPALAGLALADVEGVLQAAADIAAVRGVRSREKDDVQYVTLDDIKAARERVAPA